MHSSVKSAHVACRFENDSSRGRGNVSEAQKETETNMVLVSVPRQRIAIQVNHTSHKVAGNENLVRWLVFT